MPLPGYLDNGYGYPSLCIIPTKPWFSGWGGHQGIWHLSGAISVEIPNNPIENIYKLLQIQFIWASEDGLSVPCISLEAYLANGNAIPANNILLLDQTDIQLEKTGVNGAGEYWHHTTALFKIIPNPATETFNIGSAIMVDGLIIDTICIPEPTTMFFLIIGTVVFKKAYLKKVKN
jgi:hypothetical protein